MQPTRRQMLKSVSAAFAASSLAAGRSEAEEIPNLSVLLDNLAAVLSRRKGGRWRARASENFILFQRE
jgi:hypothetical protein